MHMGLTSTAGFAPRVYTTLRASDALRLFAYDYALLSRNVVMCILYEYCISVSVEESLFYSLYLLAYSLFFDLVDVSCKLASK